MCGICVLLFDTCPSDYYNAFMCLKPRGPEKSCFVEYDEPYNIKVGFHRLAIMDTSSKGNQPFIMEYERNDEKRLLHVVCNGEIYNFKELVKQYDLKLIGGSDCEVIPLLYIKLGIKMIPQILGEFAYIIIDMNMNDPYDIDVHACRDPFGIRPLFICYDEQLNNINFSSEIKGLVNVQNKSYSGKVEPFKPGHYMSLFKQHKKSWTKEYFQYYSCTNSSILYKSDNKKCNDNGNDNDNKKCNDNDNKKNEKFEFDNIKQNIVTKLTEAIRCRLITDRPLGCLLSGGLDSSLVASIAAKILKETGQTLHTFSIGMPGSTDEKYAKMVADHIKSKHTHISLDASVWVDALKDVLYCTETYDITTIRASTGQYLLAKWISQNTDIKVLLIGDGSDELCAGYIYFEKAPSAEELHKENIRLLEDISYFDVLRADRGIASNGLEARVPFLDIRFVDYYLSIDPNLRTSNNRIEKWLLRESFNGLELLPEAVLFRKKEAFSDGVSSVQKSWFTIIQEHVETLYTDQDLQQKQKEYIHNIPPSKEALYYRELFNAFFGKKNDNVIPYYWLPKWCGNIKEPSARILKHYQNKSPSITIKD